MPAEYVRGVTTPNDDDLAESLVKVSWGAEYVQVATLVRDTETGEPLNANDDEGWYIDLDRQGINNLIRRLRQARDRAYGRDE